MKNIDRLIKRAQQLHDDVEKDYSKEVDNSSFVASILHCDSNESACDYCKANNLRSLADVLRHSCKVYDT